MNTQILNLKDGNRELYSICDDIDSYFSHIEHKLKVINSEFIVLSKLNRASLHSYCLDSIQFQLRLYTNYLSNHKNTFCNILNQVYRDYYKLYKLISRYIHSHITDKKVLMLVETDTFPVYKDLDIQFIYEKQTVDSIYDTLINIINALNEFCNSKQESLLEQKKMVDRGYDIENLISSHNYTREIVVNHIRLYIDYLCYFKKYKKKYLSELYSKITTLYSEIPPIEIMKNMKSGIRLNIDSSNNNILQILQQSPSKNNSENNRNQNITTVINELTRDNIENNNINNGYLVSPTNSEVSSIVDNNFIEENDKNTYTNIKTETEIDIDTYSVVINNDTPDNITNADSISDSNVDSISDSISDSITNTNTVTNTVTGTDDVPKKKRGRPKKIVK